MTKKIAIYDFGSEQLKDTVDYVNQVGFDVVEYDFDQNVDPIELDQDFAGVILAGGPFTIYDGDIDKVDDRLFELDIPLFATGRGMQVMIGRLGGTVTPAGFQHDPSPAQLKIHNTEAGLFKGLEDEKEVQLGFDAKVSELPEGFDVVANGEGRPFGAIENQEKDLYGVQFVLDVARSDFAKGILDNYLNEIVGK